MRKSVFAALFTAAISLTTAAEASVTITGQAGNPGWLTSKIIYTPGGLGGKATTTSLNVYAGRNRLTGYDNSAMSAVTFDSYCIDIFNRLSSANATFEIGSLSLLDQAKQADLYRLLLSTAGYIDAQSNLTKKKRISAAIQLAAWEIVNEASGSAYSLGAGAFQVASNYGSVKDGTASNPSALVLAQGYLDSLPTATIPAGNRLRTLEAINPISNQRQVFIAAVPEPATWSMLILGFGVVGGTLRTRRKNTISFA
ncbi:PEPxxWA-CTERM sorting domain-containing protein [Qipengyuania sp.]|uniref:PEPxxWA-CTERM sorting domain-containing protein n=1 Tax=Qipengyuania sp. TaxID=2004515 RepID=UPI0035C7D501